MPNDQKRPGPEEQATAHPETQPAPQRVPDDKSSKVSHKQRDARTGHDKDGNEDQARNPRKAS